MRSEDVFYSNESCFKICIPFRDGGKIDKVTINAVELVRSNDNGGTYECGADNCWFTSTVIATDSNGQANYKLLKAPAGWYRFTVEEVGGAPTDPANNSAVYHLQ